MSHKQSAHDICTHHSVLLQWTLFGDIAAIMHHTDPHCHLISCSYTVCELAHVGRLSAVSPCPLLGAKGDYYAARKFISAMLINAVPDRSKEIYSHYTCATDTENMRIVFDKVRNFILERHFTDLQLS